MPLMNGRGPLGEGPMSGRGYGRCAAAQKDFGQQARAGMCGLGGMRMRRRFGSASPIDQLTALKQEAQWLKKRLHWIRQQSAASSENSAQQQ
jgi:hypothetical protein